MGQASANGLIEPRGRTATTSPVRRIKIGLSRSGFAIRAILRWPGGDSALMAALQDRMAGDQDAILQDPDLVSEGVHFDNPLSGCIGHAVKVAADANHTLVRDAPFQLEHRAEGQERQRFEMWLLLGTAFQIESGNVGSVRTPRDRSELERIGFHRSVRWRMR